MPAPHPLVEILQEARKLVALPDNDFSWSSWEDSTHALGEIDQLLDAFSHGDFSQRGDLDVLFAVTGPMQELSLSSGWGEEFLRLAARFDEAALQP